MPPAGSVYSIWTKDDYDSPDLLLDCLLPTGIIIQMVVPKNALISKIKTDLLTEAIKYPMFHMLKANHEIYVFMCVNEFGAKMELEDESRRLCDVRPFSALLQLVESKNGERQRIPEKLINAQISILLGKGLQELESIKDSEVIDFRNHMRMICEKIAKEKENQEWLDRAMCYFPPDLSPDPKLPPFLLTRLEQGFLRLIVRFENSKDEYAFKIPHTSYPEDVIKMTLEQQALKGNGAKSDGKYVLKICGIQEYLLGHYPLSQFMYIRRLITKEHFPELIVVRQETALDYKPEIKPRFKKPPAPPHKAPVLPASGNEQNVGHSLFNITENFTISIRNISNITIAECASVKLRACLYHGGDTLCASITSNGTMVVNGCASWNETLTFDLPLQNIPRMARLCFMVYALSDRRTGKRIQSDRKMRDRKKEMYPLAWVNIPVFDYKGIMRSDAAKKLYMWFVTDIDMLSDEMLNPIGTVELNPDVEDAVCLVVSFSRYNLDDQICYPSFDKVLDVAARHSDGVKTEGDVLQRFGMLRLDPSKVTKNHLEALRLMVDRDQLHQLHEQEKELIWNLRYECREHFPHSLPKLLSCVSWNSHVEVALMQALLQIWPKIPPEQALELLDFQYADKEVRKFAVKCLQEMSDSELCQYLLQFTQVLKYESYLECDLIEFLLQRALNNHKIGHYFFWLLRSEMHVPSVSIRFALILEAYFRGNNALLAELFKQVEGLHGLRALYDHVELLSPAINGRVSKEKLVVLQKALHKDLEKTYGQSLAGIKCPLNPRIRLKGVSTEQCKVMGSKQKPLWLVCENADLYGPTIPLMYKRGDDLRQDMLILQILHIMDNIWQSEGLDFRLCIYGCLPMGHNEGLIEIVTKASTLAKIQIEFSDIKLTASFNKACLYEWLKKHNTEEKSFKSALNEFLMSCAGYCVATYVLGVADRHSDNIMLRENGQLFHIDFGHILGHFKSKYGLKRERVPFVLTSDLVYVISPKDQGGEKFVKFRMLCCRAFQILRKHSKFLITLFMMMMNTGIPEVSCIKDIEYLKDTLVPHMTEDEADKHFDVKFNEALKSSWKTSADWMIHNNIHY